VGISRGCLAGDETATVVSLIGGCDNGIGARVSVPVWKDPAAMFVNALCS